MKNSNNRLDKSASIWIVDDSKLEHMLTVAMLNNDGFTNIECFSSGKEVLEYSPSSSPSIIIADITMPEMDGIELCKKLRENSYFTDVPIIIQSGVDNVGLIEKAFENGATDYVTKGDSAHSRLISRVYLHLKSYQALQEAEKYRLRLEKELEAARQMQESILPQETELAEFQEKYNLDFAAYHEYCSELGGDFWGIKMISHAEFAVYIADFAGHGVASAMNTFRLHAALQEGRGFYSSPEMTLSKLNGQLNKMLDTGQYATMFYGVVNIEENYLQYSTAGALPPIVMNSKGEASVLGAEGTPLGAVKGIKYDTREVKFSSGDTLMLYSDALVETKDGAGEYLTDGELTKLLNDSADISAEQKLEKLLKLFRDHMADELSDDLTISILTRN